jgi:hypothetical protein
MDSEEALQKAKPAIECRNLVAQLVVLFDELCNLVFVFGSYDLAANT